MRGITATAQNEPQLNPSWMHLPASKAPGWGINGPGVSAEWTQGGESEWNSVNASADETRGTISQDIEVPRAGEYKIWVRYADWANKTENFTVTIRQNNREVFSHEYGAKPSSIRTTRSRCTGSGRFRGIVLRQRSRKDRRVCRLRFAGPPRHLDKLIVSSSRTTSLLSRKAGRNPNLPPRDTSASSLRRDHRWRR
jgi:hypothetical protein